MALKKHMTQREAVSEFKKVTIPELQQSQKRRKIQNWKHLDKSLLGEAWVNYIDLLERAGYISEKQANEWGNPFNK